MARTRTTIRRVDPWSVLKFAFVANLVLLGVYLLVGAVAWSFVRRLQLIDTLCELALNVGFRECAVDGQALFDTVLVLGLLGVVIQTGVFVFLAFLANLIFDLIGGIAVTLDYDAPSRGSSGALSRVRRGVGTTVGSSRTDRDRDGAIGGTGATRARTAGGGGATRQRSSGSAVQRQQGADQTGVLTPTGPSSRGSAGRPARGDVPGRDDRAAGTGRADATRPAPRRETAASDDDRLFGDD